MMVKYVVFPSKCEFYSEGNNNIFSLTGMQCLDIALGYISLIIFSQKRKQKVILNLKRETRSNPFLSRL